MIKIFWKIIKRRSTWYWENLWKFPLIASSFYAAKESFLSFKDVFRPKIRGQHGAGITNIESKIVKNYSKYGSTDTEIFKKVAQQIFR